MMCEMYLLTPCYLTMVCISGLQGFVPLYNDFEAFAMRHHYRRIRDCLERPICSDPGAEFDVAVRTSPDHNYSFE